MWIAIKQIFARYLLCARHCTDTRYTRVSRKDMDLIIHSDNGWMEYYSFLNYNYKSNFISYKDRFEHSQIFVSIMHNLHWDIVNLLQK